MARPTKPIDLTEVQRLASEGHTLEGVCGQLGISYSTLNRRRQVLEDLEAAIKAGRESAHSTVSNTLFQQCVKGNVTAIIWYEKTRRGFRDVQDVTTGGQPLPTAPTIREVVVLLTQAPEETADA